MRATLVGLAIGVQETLVNKTHSTDMAQRLRDERMAELKGIQNRWKNGILKDDEEEEKKVLLYIV